ncbi:MAG TPA: LemA family protein [Actinomycetota bacterium]|nr:LemA family protein [Actinomycetota bacterium]
MTVFWIILAIVVLVVIAGIVSYNRFVSQRAQIRSSFSNIETELRRRYDLIPNLVETVRGYASHEREVLENVTRARAAAAGTTGSPAEQAAAEGPFVAALRQLFAVVENYPQLRANENFIALQSELANTEDRIQASRRFYNANVQDYNRRVGSFPSNVVAKSFNFQEEEFFEIEPALRAEVERAPRVEFNTGGAEAGRPAGTSGPIPPSPPAPAPEPPPAPAS